MVGGRPNDLTNNFSRRAVDESLPQVQRFHWQLGDLRRPS
jgi:hypothetical protein